LRLYHSLRMMASHNPATIVVADVAEAIVVRVVVDVVVSGASEAAIAEIEAPSVVVTEVASVVVTGVDGLMATGGATKIVDVAGDADADVERGEVIMRGAEFLLQSSFCEQRVLRVVVKALAELWPQLHAFPYLYP